MNDSGNIDPAANWVNMSYNYKKSIIFKSKHFDKFTTEARLLVKVKNKDKIKYLLLLKK